MVVTYGKLINGRRDEDLTEFHYISLKWTYISTKPMYFTYHIRLRTFMQSDLLGTNAVSTVRIIETMISR